MTESETTFKAICDRIADQNRALLARIPKTDFDPGVELDNTRNNACYMLTDFFSALKLFPHGEVPYSLASDVIRTTDQLVDSIRTRYPTKEIQSLAHKAGLAFRGSKRIWRIRKPPKPLSDAEYAAALDACLESILDTLDDLNAALDQLSFPTPSAAKLPRKRGKKCRGKGPQSAFKLHQRDIFEKYLSRHPITPSVSAITRAHQCWLEHKKEWDAAAKKKTGYFDHKKLARSI